MNEIFSDQGIEELRQRLGLADQGADPEEDPQIDPSLFDDGDVVEFIQSDSPAYVAPEGINFPQNISVDSGLITYRVGPDGATVADIIVQFNDVVGAIDYSVKYVSQT